MFISCSNNTNQKQENEDSLLNIVEQELEIIDETKTDNLKQTPEEANIYYTTISFADKSIAEKIITAQETYYFANNNWYPPDEVVEPINGYITNKELLEKAILYNIYQNHLFIEPSAVIVEEELNIDLISNSFNYYVSNYRDSEYEEDENYLHDFNEVNGSWEFHDFNNDVLTIKIEGTRSYEYEYLSFYGPEKTTEVEKEEFSDLLTIMTSSDQLTKLKRADFAVHDKYNIGTKRKLTSSDLSGLVINELAYLRNEFYARKGYVFQTNMKMKNFFEKQSWYSPVSDNNHVKLNVIEKQNTLFIKKLEESKK